MTELSHLMQNRCRLPANRKTGLAKIAQAEVRAYRANKKGPPEIIRKPFFKEASAGVEPAMADLQSAALATWPRRHIFLLVPADNRSERIRTNFNDARTC